MDGVRPVSARVQKLERWQEAEKGTWGIAVLVRPSLPIESTRVLPMRTLAYRPCEPGRHSWSI